MWNAKRWTHWHKHNRPNHLQSIWDRFADSSEHNRRDRLYFPIDLSAEVQENINRCTAMAERLQSLLTEWSGKKVDLDAHSYMAGLCSVDGRQIRVAKLLNSIIKEFKLQSDDRLNEVKTAKKRFEEDEHRALAKLGNDPCMVVISRHAYDVASMSTNRGWTSCFDLENGEFLGDMKDELKDGMIVAYLVRATDLNIRHPVARIAIAMLPDQSKLYVYQSHPSGQATIFGVQSKTFADFVNGWIATANQTIS